MATVQVGRVDVRPVRPADMESVYDLEEECFKDPYPAYFLDQLAEASPLGFLVAVVDGKVVGYGVVDRWSDHNHLVSIAVRSSMRRKGIGKRLLDALEEGLSPGKALRLEVRKSNVAAIEFYLKEGFGTVGVAEGYYGDGEDALLLEKKPSFEK